jgi:protein involved in polysaccharide export with SLBB domain
VAPPASPPAAEASSVEPRYVRTRCDQSPETAPIAPGDRLAIRVEHMEEVSGTVEVARDGRIRLPLLGSVPASGRNQRELVADLSQRLTVYLQTPRVEVALERDCAK